MKINTQKTIFRLKLKGKTAVFVDWANVYNWRNEIKKDIDPQKLFTYLKSYKEIRQIRFYFGTDHTHPASEEFIRQIRKMGYFVVTKNVKFLKVYNEDKSIYVWKRKCDFDLEIGLDAFELIDKFDTFVFFSGDGDLKTLYERLIQYKKQVIVIYMYGHLGREIWTMQKSIFKAAIKKFGIDLYKKMTPNRRSGA